MKSVHRDQGTLSTLETVLRLHGLFRHRMHPLDLSPLQASMVLYLDRHPHCEMCEIGSALCIPTLSAVETVQRLQRHGWIRKPQINVKRTLVKLQLTAAGRALAQQLKENIDVTNRLFALADTRTAA